MRVAYVVPGPMSKGPMGRSEMERREALLQGWAFAGTQVAVVDVPNGPASIESAYEEQLSIPPTLDRLRQCESEGVDAAIIGCFGDPGLEAARELVDMPVIGPCEASALLAASLGHRFTILTIYDSMAASQEYLVHRIGVRDKLASVRATDIAVLDLMKSPDRTLARVLEVGDAAIREDRADALVFGCMTMSFLGLADTVSQRLGVPAINAGRAALKAAEAIVAQGLSHSKRAYPRPPKLTTGIGKVEDLALA